MRNRVAEDQSDNPTVVEYAVQFLMKRKSPKAAANATVRKLHGQNNLFLGEEVTIDAKKLEEAIWVRLVEFAERGVLSFKAGMEHYALDSTVQHFNQKPTLKKELRKRILAHLGRNPFTAEERLASISNRVAEWKKPSLTPPVPSLRKMSIDEMKKVGKSLLNWEDSFVDEFVGWVYNFRVSGRAPRGMTKDFEKIKSLRKSADIYLEDGHVPQPIGATFSWWKEDDIDRIVDALIGKERVERQEKIKIGQITYCNSSSMGEKRFLATAKKIAAHLKGFQGFHRKSIATPFEIHFRPTRDMRARAVYKRDLDQIWVKESAKVDNELYGHLLYQITHELGHRYEKKHGIPSDVKMKVTTRYSKTDSMAGEEWFAELFALSYWPQQYSEYSEQINEFVEAM